MQCLLMKMVITDSELSYYEWKFDEHRELISKISHIRSASHSSFSSGEDLNPSKYYHCVVSAIKIEEKK